jgi:hypothetical protein
MEFSCAEIRIFMDYWLECKMVQTSLKISLAVSLKVIDMPFINYTPRYLPKRDENICPHKDLYINVHSSIIQK